MVPAVITLLGVLLLSGCLPIPTFPRAAASPSPGTDATGVQAVTSEGNTHIRRPNRVSYTHQPPSSGMHYSDSGAPRRYEAYEESLWPEEWIHNLEHGAIVVVYRCEGTECDDMYAEAGDLLAALPEESKFGTVKALTTPYQDMKPKVAVLAWTKEQDFEKLDVAGITEFYRKFVNKGPELLP
ncbi:MAG: hypothetical protein QOE92_1015 [Chloroflexota bacterium]|jgi:hypothetical protein|nr:hypothetical protein [Chloroflexota bacterium]